ncbi:MAG: right-handed parallel beta-helix repeat-containing protein [Candidatus Bathyarchaeales archaeon]
MEMKKTTLTLFLIIFLSALTSFKSAGLAKAEVYPLSPGVIHVPGDYSTIQAAVNAANPWDTIIVSNGTYKERVTIDKPLRLIGENRSSTIIDAIRGAYAVKITSNNVTVSGFTLQNTSFDPFAAWGGIWLNNVSNIAIANCTVTQNLHAVWFNTAQKNIFRGNEFVNNTYDFGFFGELPKYFVQDIDSSNTVNGKPIYWLVNQHNVTVPSDAGMVAAVDSTNIRVKDLALGKNGRSVLFVSTNNSFVENVTVEDSEFGIYLLYSHNNTVRNNRASNSPQYGIVLTYSNGNTVSNNNVSHTGYNLKLVTSHQNKITGNILTNSTDMYGLMLDAGCLNNTVSGNIVSFNKQGGIALDDMSRWNVFTHNFVEGNKGPDGGFLLYDGSRDNLIAENTFLNNSWGVKAMSGYEFPYTCKSTIYKNNFLYNTVQTYHDAYTKNHIWDNGAEGNYWSDFVGIDANLDGISDKNYTMDVNNVDLYPLMEPWSRNRTYTVLAGDRNFTVNIVSNSTIGGFHFDQALKHVAFNVTGPSGAKGFFNVTIPKILLNVNNPPYQWGITLDDNLVTLQTIITENGTHTFFYLTYALTTHRIRIIGTDVYPEFSVPAVFLLTVFIATVSVGVLRRKRH